LKIISPQLFNQQKEAKNEILFAFFTAAEKRFLVHGATFNGINRLILSNFI